ncbi:hypothetical protein HNQ44_001439 [Planomicrobium koreense]|uniref:Uncharacterized protein n=1 Tax=Planococcus koreensis TaxID=112331 RepID=A0A7W8CQY3_9BACL|nr:hypothetical protein [Planococcus koreensis]MBB5180015.1 hypothetical protein [Planococcus koreensis]
MLIRKNKTLLLFSVLIAVMAAISSWGGLFVDGLYRDNELVVSAWQGNDLVTLFVVVPMLLVSLFFSLRGAKKGRLFWMGSLWYMVYNYMFYLFGAAFNAFFLLYAALFVFSICTLVLALLQTDVQEFSRSFSEKLPYKTVSLFMLLFAALLGGMWIALSLSFVFTGQVHESITQTGHPTAVVFAVDLTLLIPSMIVGGVLLWRKNRWGPVVGSVVLVKATAYGLALIIMTAMSYRNTAVIDPFIPLWVALTLGCSIALVLLMRNIKR